MTIPTVPAGASLADVGEFGLIGALVALFPQGEHVLVGPGDDQLAELVDVAGLGTDDDVVRAGDVLGKGHPLDLRDRRGHLSSLAHVGLDQDVGLDHHVLLLVVAQRSAGAPKNLAQPIVCRTGPEPGRCPAFGTVRLNA